MTNSRNTTDRRRTFRIPAIALGVLFQVTCSVRASASFDANAYRELALTFSALSTSPIVLSRQGTFIDPAFDADSAPDREFLAAALDTMLMPSLLYHSANRQLGDLYLDILSNSTWATTPLLLAQRSEMARLHTLLFGASQTTPTVDYQNYLTLKKAYDEIAHQYETTPPDEITPELQDKRDRAEQNLELKGHNAIYGPAETNYLALQAQASYKWRDMDLQSAMSATSIGVNGERVMRTTTSTPLEDADSIAWTHLTLTGGQLHNPARSPTFGGTISDTGLSWWSFPNTVTACPSHLSDDHIVLQFDAALISAERDWFDDKLFTSRAWSQPNIPKLISDGQTENNIGSSPLVTNAVVLVKDLILSGDDIRRCLPRLRAASLNAEPVNFGPFAVGGPPGTELHRYLSPIITRQSVKVPYTQVVAFAVTILPRSPDPNPDYLWPTR